MKPRATRHDENPPAVGRRPTGFEPRQDSSRRPSAARETHTRPPLSPCSLCSPWLDFSGAKRRRGRPAYAFSQATDGMREGFCARFFVRDRYLRSAIRSYEKCGCCHPRPRFRCRCIRATTRLLTRGRRSAVPRHGAFGGTPKGTGYTGPVGASAFRVYTAATQVPVFARRVSVKRSLLGLFSLLSCALSEG